MVNKFVILFICLLITNVSFAKPQAAIAMPDKYSADVAVKILQQGGNAIDVAVGSAFVLAVTYPEAGNLGGGGFMTIFAKPSNKEPRRSYFLDYREKAPLLASKNMYLDSKKNVIPYKSLIGYKASGVPGTVAGMWDAHQKFGSLPWQDLLQPAIKLAKNGFKVDEKLPATANWYKKWILNKSKQPLNFNKYFGSLKKDQLFKQPILAKTLNRLASFGASDFYTGQTAKYIVEQMQQHGGLITKKDLTEYKVKWRKPIVANWLGYQVISAPPPSSGGVAIVQLLKMKEILDAKFEIAKLKATKKGIDEQVVEAHFYAELSKRVYADRAKYLGDADFINVPVAELIAEQYLNKRAKQISFDKISDTEKVSAGLAESFETTHFSIVDFAGNAVANTYTLNMPFGSGVVIEKAGFLMNNEMDDFSTKPNVANIYGVIGGKANEIAPAKRMLSSMSPTILLKNNQVDTVVGTPGGSSIITSVFQTLVNVKQKNMTAEQAVDATRVHHQLLPKDIIMYNPSLKKEVKKQLEKMGYQLRFNNYLGDVQLVTKKNGRWQGAADKRGRGVARVIN
jgi:gamma-glutamyltranspeptidase/glutathione hydrolase